MLSMLCVGCQGPENWLHCARVTEKGYYIVRLEQIPLLSMTNQLSCPPLLMAQNCLEQQEQIEAWFQQQWTRVQPVLYSSVDLRNAGFKLAPVDTNLFPAGFNNLHPACRPFCAQAATATITEIAPNVTRLLLIPENHTRNPHYLDNLATLYDILLEAGYDVRLGYIDPEREGTQTLTSATQRELLMEPVLRCGDRVGLSPDFWPDGVVLNNDLSSGVPDVLHGVSQFVMPAVEMGWTYRLKSEYFGFYRDVCEEFSKAHSIDPWLFMPLFDQCDQIEFMSKGDQSVLVDRAAAVLKAVKEKYTEYGVTHSPFLVVKADAGTYGMAVMVVKDAAELNALNRKQRTRMSVSKGGVAVQKVIIQEGVHTFETLSEQSAIAEPVVYSFGRHVVGGFYRIHQDKGPNDNLNVPGMYFEPFAFEDISSDKGEEASSRFYMYSVVARLAALAASREVERFRGAR